jgi:hypothetical protein
MNVNNISRFKKERYLKSLSEDDFRDKVVRPLFLRLGYKDGRDLCGPSEHGKDAIFTTTDRLGFIDILAVQTKKGNLNLASKATSNLVSAITQINTALSTDVVLLSTKQRKVPSSVILCASGKINDAAKQHILTNITNPNIKFLDADEIIPLIDEGLPELWYGIDADIMPYFQAIRRLVVGDSQAGSGSKYELILDGGAGDDTFVSLNLYRNASRIKRVHGKVTETPHFEEFPLESLIGKKINRAIILGEAGSGKSTGLLRIAYTLATKSIEEKKYYIPILLKALDVCRNKPENLLDYCDQVSKSLSNADKSCFTRDDLDSGRFVLLVDAIDELSSDEDRVYVLNLIDDLTRDYPRIQVIITSRPDRFISEIVNIKQYEELRITPISWRQAEKIVKSLQAGRKIPESQSKELLRRLEKIHGIELNPLLVTVFAATTDVCKQDIPANITELFKKFTELMLGRWDESKGLKQQYQWTLKDFVITRIAFYMHKNKTTVLLKSKADEIVHKELSDRGHDADVDMMLSEIFYRSGLFRVIGQEIGFRHLLLQEFFAGRGIESPDFVSNVIVDSWWKRALVFYFGANPERIDLLCHIMNVSNDIESYKLLEASTTVGLALQACYLSPVAEKLEVWKWVSHSLYTAQNDCLRMFDPGNKYPQLSFVHYYLYSRDSVALSNLKQNIQNLKYWLNSIVNMDERYSCTYWLIIGLIECGEIGDAESLIKDFDPDDQRLSFAIHLGCFLAAKIRPISKSEKQCAINVCEYLDGRVSHYKLGLLKEIGSTLLELRNGEIKSIESEVE